MAYSSIVKPTDHFNTKLYTGTGSSQSITGVGFQPDWVWIKTRTGNAYEHKLTDSIRGVTKGLASDASSAEFTDSQGLTAFNTDGYTVGTDNYYNKNTNTLVSWNWLAGGTAPAITYSVKVVSDSGNKYRFDDFGTSAVTLDLQEGGTYTFDGSDSSMASHPIKLSETSDGTHGGGSSYNTGVTYQLDGSSVTESAYVSGYSSASSRKLIITVAASAPTLYYYCHYHSGMGGQANTNSTHGSSNFGGNIQSNVSSNTTAGISIGTYSSVESNTGKTVGHGLSSKPDMVMVKKRTGSAGWVGWHQGLTGGNEEDRLIALNNTNASNAITDYWGSGFNSTTFGLWDSAGDNSGTGDYWFFAFKSVKGYSKFGSYTGNGNSNGAFIYTGFKPAWVMIKQSSGSGTSWNIWDNKRLGFNIKNYQLEANTTVVENTSLERLSITSNGFKCLTDNAQINGSGNTYIYMAFAENPFVANDSGTAVPVTAR